MKTVAAVPADDSRMLLVIGMGLIGGIGIGYHAFQHLFVEGLEDHERKEMLKLGASAAVMLGIAYLVDLEPYQKYLDPFSLLSEIQQP